jgi:chorismate-pyruvate lyase
MHTGTDTDLLQRLLGGQGDRPTGIGSLNLRALSPLHRALLVLDGTVTTFLESYTLEPMEIALLAQGTHVLEQQHRWLDAPRGTELWLRQVFIRGTHSREVYAYAVSLVVPSRLPSEAREALQLQGAGIGRVIGEAALESRREILWLGRESRDALRPEVRSEVQGNLLVRAYRIIIGGQVVALVHEAFPYNQDRTPSLE